MKRLLPACIFLLVFPVFLSLRAAVAGRITGRVTDQKDGSPLIGANIVLEKTILGASSDAKGIFRIAAVPAGTYSIRVSMIGYKTLTLQAVTVREGLETALDVALSETPIELDPLVVTAEKHPQSLGSSHQAVTLTPQEDMIRRQSRSAGEALSLVPGIHFNEENISIRGSSGYSVYTVGSRVLLMIDGIPVLTSDMGTISWDLLPLMDAERIEVVRGAGSALYGSSAMGGVVNIMTREPEPGGRIVARVRAGVYDKPAYPEWEWTDALLHYEQFDLSYGIKIGPVGFRLSGSGVMSTGYMENDSLAKANITARIEAHLPWHSRLDVYAGWMKLRQDFFIQWINQNHPFQVPESTKDDEVKQQAWNLYLRYSVPLSSRFGLKFRVSELWFDMESQYTAGDPAGFLPAQGLGGEMQADWVPARNHHIIFGSEFKRDISGSKYFGNHEGYSVSPYLQESWNPNSIFNATLGLRLDHHVLAGEETNTHLSPKLGINVTPHPSTNIRAAFGGGFRAATVFEKYVHADYAGFNIIANPDLEPERSWFTDIGIRQSILDHIQIEYSEYFSEYRNMIEPVINFLGTIQFQNHVRAWIFGRELGVTTWWWKERIGFAGSVANMSAWDVERSEPLSYRPRWTVLLLGTLHFGPVRFQAEYQYASRFDRVEINPLDPRVSMKLVHFRLEALLGPVALQLSIRNALNYHYTQVERRMAEVRNGSVGILFDLHK